MSFQCLQNKLMMCKNPSTAGSTCSKLSLPRQFASPPQDDLNILCLEPLRIVASFLLPQILVQSSFAQGSFSSPPTV